MSDGTDPLTRDTDGDGLSDSDEIGTWRTNPSGADSDSDGLVDTSPALAIACDDGIGGEVETVFENLDGILADGGVMWPASRGGKVAAEVRSRVCQPTVRIEPDPICFHPGDERKTVVASVAPESLASPMGGELVWTLSGRDGAWTNEAVNVNRTHVGHELVCTWTSASSVCEPRQAKRTVYSCTVCACGEHAPWCPRHNCSGDVCACDDEKGNPLAPGTVEPGTWCALHRRDVEACLLDPDDRTQVPDLLAGTNVVSGVGMMPTVEEPRPSEDGTPVLFGASACSLVPVNDDDDDGDWTVDFLQTEADLLQNGYEDDLVRFLPSVAAACPCPTHPNGEPECVEVKGGIRILRRRAEYMSTSPWTGTSADMGEMGTENAEGALDWGTEYSISMILSGQCVTGFDGVDAQYWSGVASETNTPYMVAKTAKPADAELGDGMRFYVEGRKPSWSREDSHVIFRVTDADGVRSYASTNFFTVLGLRLIPDLNRNDVIDAGDRALMGELAQCGRLGYCVTPGRRHPIFFRNDVGLMGGTYDITLAGVTNGVLRLYRSRDAAEPFIQSGGEAVSISVQKYCVANPSAVYWVEASTNGVTGVISWRYRADDGIGCVAGLRVTAPDFRIAGDGGVRDGKIDFDDPADTNVVFWINDDYDVILYNDDDSSEMDFQEDDNREFCNSIRNCDDDVIGMRRGEMDVNFATHTTNKVTEMRYCLRDLEDFDRLCIRADGLLQGNTNMVLEFRCVSRDAEGRPLPAEFVSCEKDTPSVNLFEAVEEAFEDRLYLTGTGVKKYESGTDEACAERKEQDASSIVKQVKKKRLVTVDGEWCSPERRFRIGNLNRFLYEGRAKGAGALEVRVRCGNLVLAQTSLVLELDEARAFTEVYRIPRLKDVDDKEKDEFAVRVSTNVVVKSATARMPERDDRELALLVLGWNVPDEENDAWNDMVFKRLFWHGYRGRAGSFQWPCLNGMAGACLKLKVASDPSHFDRSEHRAWLCAEVAARKFHELVRDGTHLTLIVHSQGNVLVGEALRRLGREHSEDLGNITYLAWQGAIPAQMYTTRYDVTVEENKAEMDATGIAELMQTFGDCNDWLNALKGDLAPDLFGHYVDKQSSLGYGDHPYLEGALKKLRHSKNFFNRLDYALNVWLGNHGTRPDNLKRGLVIRHIGDNLNFDYESGTIRYLDAAGESRTLETGRRGIPYAGRFYQKRTTSLVTNAPFVVYPGDRADVKGDEAALIEKDLKGEFVDGGETAKWCVFSFVVKSRSLAIGQVGMEGVFAASTNLKKKYEDKFTNRHYGHSFQFRSNIQDTWGLWEEIMEGIRANSGKGVK